MPRASYRLSVKGFIRVGIAVALALSAWPLPASAQSAGSIWWQLPTQVAPAGEGFYGITCASTSLCLATATSVQAGSPSDVASSTDPTGGASAWRFDPVDRNTRPLSDGGTFPAGLKGITCPSVSLCVAVDDAGYVLTTRNPTVGAGAWTNTNISGSPSFTAVACASESLCVATAKRGPPADILAAVSTNPTGGAGAWRSEEIHSSDCAQGCINGGYTQGISCPSESFCAAVDYAGHILTSRDPANDPGPWRVAFSDPNVDGFYPAPIPTIGCPSTRLCLGFDTAGYFIRSTDPTADSPTWQMSSFFAPVQARSYFTRDLSCATPSLCMVLFPDAGSIVASDDPANPQTWTSAKIDPDASLTGIACPSAGLCIAVDTAAHAGGPAGRVIVGRAGPTRAQLSALLRHRLAPHGKASRMGALLKHRGLAMPLASPVPGLIHITWSYTPEHARSHRRALVVADGTHTYPTPDRATVRLALTRRGRALLEHRRLSLRLTAQATFTPFVGDPLTATRAIRLPR